MADLVHSVMGLIERSFHSVSSNQVDRARSALNILYRVVTNKALVRDDWLGLEAAPGPDAFVAMRDACEKVFSTRDRRSSMPMRLFRKRSARLKND